MRLVKPKAELLPWIPGVEGVYQVVELAGRTCYKSTDKITEDSAKPFVDRMIASHHTAMLEHGTVYLKVDFKASDPESNSNGYDVWSRYKDNIYSRSFQIQPNFPSRDGFVAVTTNLRVLVENNWLDDLQYICDPTEYHEMRYSFKLTTSIGVTRELNRHRVNSIAEQSTRYCNYSKDKFGGEVTYCIPSWMDSIPCLDEDGHWDANTFFRLPQQPVIESDILGTMLSAEAHYLSLLEQGWVPQQAREVLPLCTATEIVHTAFASDWRHFFDLRLFAKTGNPHPNMLQLAKLMQAEAEKNGIWEDIMKQPSKFE